MRASTARLTNSPVRLADLQFPQVNRLIHRTRLAFIHLDNMLAYAKRDRDGRIDGYIAAHLPDECVLLFFRKGEAVNAASLHTAGRHVITITEALKRMRAEVERADLEYCAAPMEQLAWMYASCAGGHQPRAINVKQPEKFFPLLQQEKVSGVLELISNGRVSYLRFDQGKYLTGHFCDKPSSLPPARYRESLFDAAAGGAEPEMSAGTFPADDDLPAQAATALVNTYRELYWRIVDAVEREFPGEAKRRAQKVTSAIVDTHQALALISVPRGTDTRDSVVRPEELSTALTDWTLQLLEGAEVMMPGAAPKVLKDATREHRYVLQAASFYGRLPWRVTTPGPTAVVFSLAASGIPVDRYVFLGFVARKGSDRRRLLSTAASSEWTVVLFEAPNRVTQLLADLIEVCGPERQAAVSRELTKVFEETRSGTLQELSEHYAEGPVRGEVKVVLAGTGKTREETVANTTVRD